MIKYLLLFALALFPSVTAHSGSPEPTPTTGETKPVVRETPVGEVRLGVLTTQRDGANKDQKKVQVLLNFEDLQRAIPQVLKAASQNTCEEPGKYYVIPQFNRIEVTARDDRFVASIRGEVQTWICKLDPSPPRLKFEQRHIGLGLETQIPSGVASTPPIKTKKTEAPFSITIPLRINVNRDLVTVEQEETLPIAPAEREINFVSDYKDELADLFSETLNGLLAQETTRELLDKDFLTQNPKIESARFLLLPGGKLGAEIVYSAQKKSTEK